ncbi:TlpA family protein disulfide reductase [Candidatus Anaplasma sp. TIGMIC]|uniref:TlpA family protein disulfide reductase n=1 Tax=Candidatus Anaplasma sp. TIGMIC TaxID=3020713 RepID=UPI00232CF103|nr:TlpA disulfide reductase family protein [Candidatus Anaplasma sp. TIGMIC]MDB1135380.1 TlpA disulfide reductase family protein [Candidatus Anaplasma sp. TIGMIC]
MRINGFISLGVVLVSLFVPSGLYSKQVPGVVDSKNALPRAFTDGRLGHGIKVGERSLSDLEGNEVILSEFKGKTLFITFWAPWNLDSVTTIQGLQVVSEYLSSRGIRERAVFLPVSDTNIDDVESIKLARDSYGIGLSLYLDDDHELFDYFDVRAIPLTLIVDGDGVVIYRIAGYMKWDSDVVMKALLTVVGEE